MWDKKRGAWHGEREGSAWPWENWDNPFAEFPLRKESMDSLTL